MSFFSKADPLAKLKADLEKKPNDTRLLLELGAALKAKGAIAEAAENYLKAAKVMNDQGFAPKGAAIAKQVVAFAPRATGALEFLVRHYEESKMKEDLRPVLKSLLTVYRSDGRADEAQTLQVKLEALGPGR